MKFKKVDSKYLVKVSKGERIVEAIIKFCRENGIKSGAFYGIGALNHVELMVYHADRRGYSTKTIDGDMEILNITGNVAFLDGKHMVHAHITLSDTDLQAIGGHLKEGIVSGTLELVFTDFNVELNRKPDSETGLNILDI